MDKNCKLSKDENAVLKFDFLNKSWTPSLFFWNWGMLEAGEGGRTLPPLKILAPPLLLAPPPDFWAPRYNSPPQIFRPCNIPVRPIYFLCLLRKMENRNQVKSCYLHLYDVSIHFYSVFS